MSEPIEMLYFDWLCAKVLERNGERYQSLMKILFRTEFIWVVSADRHRVSDGLELREDFRLDKELGNHAEFENMPCSVLEVLISFADRASFQTGKSARKWFWIFITNLALDPFEEVHDNDVPLIEEILYTFIWRIYPPNGEGGLFPMHQTRNDQREIEIWYQFCEYVEDRGLL